MNELREKNPAKLAPILWLLLAGVFFAPYSLVFLRDQSPDDWSSVFVAAARRLESRSAIHSVDGNQSSYTYPPAMAMISIPLARLPAARSLAGWYLVNVAAAIIAFTCAWKLATGPPLPGRWQRPAIFLIGAALSARFFVAPLENRQFDMVIAALLFAGCYELYRGRDLAGSIWLGASASMKATPLLFVFYLLWRRKAKAALALAGTAAALNLLPDLLWPQAGGGLYSVDWHRTVLRGVIHNQPGTWASDILLNQSLAGLFKRLATFGFPLSVADLQSRSGSGAMVSPPILRLLVYGSGLLLLGLTFFRFRADGGAGRGNVAALEFSAVLCLMLLLSPMSSKSHYVVMLLPSLLLARIAVEERSAWAWIVVAALLVTGPLTAKGLIGKGLGDLTLAWGTPTWFVLISLLGVWSALGRYRGEETGDLRE